MLRLYGQWRSGSPGERTKIVQVDPRYGISSARADEWVQIRPGTDGALALGLAHVLLREGLYDRSFVAEHTLGFEAWTDASGRSRAGFKELVLRDYAPARVAELTGIPAASMIGKGDLEYAVPFYGYKRPMLANLVLMPEAEVESRYNHVERDGDTLLVDTLIPNLPGGPGRYYWAKASPLYDLAGAVVGAIETIRDTTTRREMEERLARSNAELAIAAEIQSSFLPATIPQLAGFELAAKSVMAREVGGDFFDAVPLEVIRIGQDRLGLLIADVSGKGVPAALFMALSRIVVRVNATWHHQKPADAIRDANAVIARDAKGGMFVTLFYGVLDAHEHSLTYVNAGHNPPLVYRAADGSFSELAGTGIAIGAVPDADYGAGSVVLEPGDVAVLYTDGITEAENDAAEFYGEDRLREAIAESSTLPAGEIVDAILASVQAFSGAVPQSDDITLMVVRKV
jgi:serine phosphatase RsbU (regulator of sigma subunit)